MAASSDPATARSLLAKDDEVRYKFHLGQVHDPLYNLISTSIDELKDIWAHKHTKTTAQHLQAAFTLKHNFDVDGKYELMIDILDHVPDYLSQHLALAGGSIMSHVAGMEPSDFDLCIVGSDDPELMIRELVSYFETKVSFGYVKRSDSAVSINFHVALGDTVVKFLVQISLFRYLSPSHVVHVTDLEPTCFVYYQGQLYATERAFHSLRTNTVHVSLSRFRDQYSERLVKYARRYGFYVYTPMPVTPEIHKLSNIIRFGGPKVAHLYETTLAGLLALLKGGYTGSKPVWLHLKMRSNATGEIADLAYRDLGDSVVVRYTFSCSDFPIDNLFEPGISGEPEWKTLTFAPLIFKTTDSKLTSNGMSPGKWARSSTAGLDLTDYNLSIKNFRQKTQRGR